MEHRTGTPLSRAPLVVASALRIDRRTAWTPSLVVVAHRVAGGAAGANMQRGLSNTMRDLLLGMSGATAYVLAEIAAPGAARRARAPR